MLETFGSWRRILLETSTATLLFPFVLLAGCSSDTSAPGAQASPRSEVESPTPSHDTSPSPLDTPTETPAAPSETPSPDQTPPGDSSSIVGTIDGQSWSRTVSAFHVLQDIYRQAPNPGGGSTSKAGAAEEPDESYSYWSLVLYDFERPCEEVLYAPDTDALSLTLHFALVNALHSCGVDLTAALLDGTYTIVTDWEDLVPQDLIAEGWGRAYSESSGWSDDIMIQSGTLEVRFDGEEGIDLNFELSLASGETLQGQAHSSLCSMLYGNTLGDSCGGQPF